MGLMRRHPTLPEDARNRLDLTHGERVLAVAPLVDGWAVATTHRIRLLPTDGEQRGQLWSDVCGARLDPRAAVLTISWVDAAAPTELHLTDNRSVEFPLMVRQCVDSSLVHSEFVTLPSGSTVRVALRRDPDDGLFTQVLGTDDVDLSDPATAAAVDATEARVREAAGLR